MDCTVHGIAKSQTQLNDFHFHFLSQNIERKFPILIFSFPNKIECNPTGDSMNTAFSLFPHVFKL